MGTLNNLLQVASLISVLFIQPSGGIVRKDQGPVVRDVHVFEESVRFEDTTFAALRVCVRFDRPVYVRRSNSLIQVHRASDLELMDSVILDCESKGNDLSSLRLYPTPFNVTNVVSSLFRTFREACPIGTQFSGVIFIDDAQRDILQDFSCNLSFKSKRLVGSQGNVVRNDSVLLPRPLEDEKRKSFVYQYEPKTCTGKKKEMTLLELDTMAAEHGLLTGSQALGVGIFKIIFDPVLNTVMKPVMNAIVNSFTPELDTLFEKMEADVKNQATGDIAEVTAAHVSATLTNILVDGISSRIITRVSESLTDDLGLYLQSSISEVLLPNLVSSLMKSLSLSVPETLNRVLPDLLSRSILPTMTDTLTRSLTHSLTHTISISLGNGRSRNDDEFCRLCYNSGTHCEECHNSASSVYYTSYYATYYSDFYSEYYAKYYTDAIRLIDEKRHPLSKDSE